LPNGRGGPDGEGNCVEANVTRAAEAVTATVREGCWCERRMTRESALVEPPL